VIIGVTGKKHHGKTTIGNHLADKYDFRHCPFADPMKEAVAALWGITRKEVDDYKEEPGEIPLVEVHITISDKYVYTYTWREHLQRFGTNMGRRVLGEEIWIDQLFEGQNWSDGDHIVISDVRFDNEAEALKRVGGWIIQVVRPDLVDDDEHESEDGIDPDNIDYVIINDDSLEHLQECVDEVLTDIRTRRDDADS
jgi:hypothetical protein